MELDSDLIGELWWFRLKPPADSVRAIIWSGQDTTRRSQKYWDDRVMGLLEMG